MRSSAFATVVLAGLLGACSATPTAIPARNLERPGDMAFVCLAVDQTGVLSGQPMCQCHPPGKKDPAIQATNASPRQLGTFALVTNTARGEMAAVDLDKGKLIDLDPSVFGFNMLPVGSMPESLSASYDGCWVAVANRNSCDLSLVDPSSLLASLFKFADGTVPRSAVGGDPTVRVTPQTASGRPLHASPKEIAFLLPDRAHGLCQAAAEQAALCQPAALSQPLALVTFPSCDLVALLDMSSGKIQDSVYIRPQGAIPAGKEPTCPVDCNPESTSGEEPAIDQDGGESASASDGGIGDGSASSTARLKVGALALLPDSSRVYVGASAADDFIAALDIVNGGFSIPSGGGKIPLEAGAIGIDHLRLSVDPFKLTLDIDSHGSFLEGRGKFLYAFARDGSVRVVNVGDRPEQECDVNAQPGPGAPTNTPCFPVNPGTRETRNPLAQGPGIRIPLLPVRTAAPPIARDIAVVDLPVSSAGINKNPQALAGQFAFLLASNDTVYILNLAPTTLVNGVVVDDVSVQTHSFREVRATGQLAPDMLMLSSTPPLRTPQATDLLFPTTPILTTFSAPRLEKVTVASDIRPYSATSPNYSTTDYWANFPYPSTYVSRVFSIVWEDTLPDTLRSSGKLSEPAANMPAGALDDAGGNFCAHDVLAGDLVVLPGCTADTDCNPQDRFSCRQPISGATGLCLRKDAPQEVIDGCARFSGSRRRYEILTARPTRLELGLHLDEVPKTSLNRIPETDGDCQPTDSHKPSGNRLGFSWQQVWPNETFKRCVQPCGTPDAKPEDADRDCRPGFVCETVPGSLAPKLSGPVNKTGYCVEAPPLKLECWSQPGNRYHVDVGNSFLVSGTALPDLKTGQTVDGQCQPDPNRDPVLTNRIPLSAPLCKTIDGVVPIENTAKNLLTPSSTPTQAALFGQSPPRPDGLLPPNLPYTPVGAPGPNPCLYQDANYDDLTSTAETTSPDGGAPPKPVKALFQNPQIRFVLTNLDQYAGDNLITRINLTGGFIPATVALPSYDVALTQPFRIYPGPTKLPDSPFITEAGSTISYPYVYILDQGRTALTPNSRGQIVRLNARKGDNALTTLDPANSGSTPFQIQ
jgi:hypothetical protein